MPESSLTPRQRGILEFIDAQINELRDAATTPERRRIMAVADQHE